MEGGDPGHVRGLIQAGGRRGRLDYSLSASASRTGQENGEGPFRQVAVGGRLDFMPQPSMRLQLTFQVTGTDARVFPDGSGGPRLAILRETEHRDSNEQIFGLRLDHTPGPKWDYELISSLYQRDQSMDSPGVQSEPGVFMVPPSRSETQYRRIRIAWRNLVRPFDAVQLAAGLEQSEEKGDRSGAALGLGPLDFEKDRGTSTLFTEVTGFLPRALTLIGGLRIDFPDEFKRAVSPRIGINFRPLPETRLHASYGRGFKLPSFYALGDPVIGNPGLTPETSSGWDIGIQQGFMGRKITAGIVYFSNIFRELIDFDPVLFRLVNRHKVRTHGVELEASVRPSTGLTVRLHGTYLDTEIVGSDAALRNRPRFSGGAVVNWSPHRMIDLYAELIAASRRFDFQIPTSQDTVAGFSRINLAATVVPAKRWKLYARVENLLNQRYEEFIGFPAPGLHVKGGMTYLF
jgi:outer membrane receptor protein involved in Fe transport